MKTNLAKILWKKEKVHWKRTYDLFSKFNSIASKLTFGVIVAFLGIIAHYCFAFMSTLWSSFLWVIARKTFKENLIKMELRLQS